MGVVQATVQPFSQAVISTILGRTGEHLLLPEGPERRTSGREWTDL